MSEGEMKRKTMAKGLASLTACVLSFEFCHPSTLKERRGGGGIQGKRKEKGRLEKCGRRICYLLERAGLLARDNRNGGK